MDNFLSLDFTYFVYKTCGTTWRLTPHIQTTNSIVIIFEGEADYFLNGTHYHVKSGDFIYTPPNSHRHATTLGMKCAAFDYNGPILSLPTVSTWTEGAKLESLVREFQYEWLEKDVGFDVKCGGIFMLILHSLIYNSSKAKKNPYVDKIKQYIINNFDKQLTREEISDLTRLNPVYCGALFRRIQGVTIAQFTNNIRIQKATDLLEDEVLNVSEVAFKCGFSDVYYFSKTFKNIMGVSPSQWVLSRNQET